jgi:hypothetical protein
MIRVSARCAMLRVPTPSNAVRDLSQQSSDMDVVLNLRTATPSMAISVISGCRALPAPDRLVHVLRWTFRRGDDAVVCELGLNSDDLAYELRLDPPSNPAGVTTELFGDAISAFQRHAAIERLLVHDGWMLEGFESQRVAR